MSVTMEEIWAQVDALLPKPQIVTTNYHFCKECDAVKVFSPEGVPTCSQCGLVDSQYIDDTAEWTSGLGDDGTVSDPSRCGQPNANPELFSDAWGKGTIISTYRGSSYENKRMAKINFHMSMNHRDRSLFHAYKDIDEACYTLPENVLCDAKTLYKKFNEGKLTRGNVRLGIKGNCVLYACRLSQIPRTTREIADMFGIQTKDISRTTDIFKEVILGKTEQNYVTKPFDVMQRLLNSFEVSNDERISCMRMCNKIEGCPELMAKTPNSIASAVILMVLATKFSKPEVCSKCGVSAPTLNKIEVIIKRHLEIKASL